MLRGRLRIRLLGLALTAAFGWGCTAGPPEVVILSPVHGSFTTGASVQVDGILLNVDSDVIADVLVNGVSVLPLGPMMTFSAVVDLDAVDIVNPIVAEVIGTGGSVLRDRITVMVGDTIQEGGLTEEGIALHFTEGGLDALEPTVEDLVDLDLAALLPPDTLVIDNFCYQDSIFGCLGRVDVTIHDNPPPSVGGFSIDIDPQTNFAEGDITLSNLMVTAKVVAVTGIGFTCYIDIDSATTNIPGDYTLAPGSPDPNEVDVAQLGGVNVSFGGFSSDTNCNGFLGFIVEALVGLFIGDVQDLMKPALENFLNTPDGNGNTPTAGAIEEALAGIEIAGPIGDAIGVALEAPLFDVAEYPDGITFGSDARITALMPDPTAVNLDESYHVDEAFPVFSTLAPNGMPYHMAMCISTSAFNQLLKSEIESGLLITSIAEFDFGSGPIPITAGLLAALLPAFGVLDPAEPLRFDLYPTLAPIVTGEPGPGSELATLRIPHLLVTVVAAVDDTVLLQAAVDGKVGLDADLVAGELSFSLSQPTAQDIGFTLLQNPLLADEANMNQILPGVIALAIPQLGSSLGTFPLPGFFGLQLSRVDVDRSGEFMSLFLDLLPAP